MRILIIHLDSQLKLIFVFRCQKANAITEGEICSFSNSTPLYWPAKIKLRNIKKHILLAQVPRAKVIYLNVTTPLVLLTRLNLRLNTGTFKSDLATSQKNFFVVPLTSHKCPENVQFTLDRAVIDFKVRSHRWPSFPPNILSLNFIIVLIGLSYRLEIAQIAIATVK